jgi:hypothetical protein
MYHRMIRGALVVLVAVLLAIGVRLSKAKDSGQWEGSDPAIAAWFRILRQPDNPDISCCGAADAYWADQIVVEGDKVFAIITDTRPDEPLGRPHVPPGTKIEIPPNKMTFKYGNPTGHRVIFLSYDRRVYCFVDVGGV